MPIRQSTIYTGSKQELLDFLNQKISKDKKLVLERALQDIEFSKENYESDFRYSWEIDSGDSGDSGDFGVLHQLNKIQQNVKISCNNDKEIITEETYGHIGQLFYLKILNIEDNLVRTNIGMVSIFVRILPDDYYQKLEERNKEFIDESCCTDEGCQCSKSPANEA